MKKYLLVTIGMMLLSPSAFAAGYGEAGCGLGSLIFGTQPGPIQVLAATTNSTANNQAFGDALRFSEPASIPSRNKTTIRSSQTTAPPPRKC